MRSSTVDRSPSGPRGSGFSSRSKFIRNKRKFRAQPFFGVPVPPLDTTVGETLLSLGTESTEKILLGVSSHDVSSVDVGLGSSYTCSQFCGTSTYQEHLKLMGFLGTAQSSMQHTMALGSSIRGESKEGFIHYNGCNMEEFQELRGALWDDIDEAQLEVMLLKNLDYVYSEAVNRIISCGYSAEEALRAVLSNGCCFGGKDWFSNIVENAMAYLTSKDGDSHGRDISFSDLKQLGKHSVNEMASVMEDVALASFNERSSMGLSSPAFSQPMTDASCYSPSSTILDAQIPTRSVSQAPSLSGQAHPGSFLPPGYAINPMVVMGTPIMPSVDDAASRRGGESSCVLVPCHETDLEKPEHPLHTMALANAQHQNVSTLKSVHDSMLQQGSLNLENSVDNCAFGMSESIHGIQHLSLNTSLSLEACCPAEIDGRGSQGIQSSTPTSVRTHPVSISSETSLSETLNAEPSLPQRHAVYFQSASDVQQTSVKSDRCKLVGVSAGMTSEQFGGCTSSAKNLQQVALLEIQPQFGDSTASCYDANGTTSMNVPGTELSLAIASVVDSGTEQDPEKSHTSMDKGVCDFNGEAQAISDSQIIEKPVSRKDEMFVKLFHRVRELEVQLRERKEWAHQKAMQAACKFSKDMSELKALRLEHEEILRLKRDTQALEDSTTKRLTEMENALKKASAQVDRANAAVRKLESENAELRAEMEAAKLSAAESNAIRQEVAKREKKSTKRVQAWEKQKAKLLEEIAAEKQQITEVQQCLSQAKQQQHETEVRWRQEEKAKDEAALLADEEKWAKEQLEAAAKRKEETLRRKSDADFQRHKDDIKRLESELGQLKIAVEAAQACTAQWSSGVPTLQSTDTGGLQSLKDINSRLLRELAELQDSRGDIRRDRECVMCMSEESFVVFLPCAHQVVCTKCNDLHEKQGMRECPSCRTCIQHRIHVFGVRTP